jgi:inner membrane protein involved in colicin E2 resistance
VRTCFGHFCKDKSFTLFTLSFYGVFWFPEGKGKLDFNAHGVVGKALRLRNLALVGLLNHIQFMLAMIVVKIEGS